jgi:hypothetical protein
MSWYGSPCCGATICPFPTSPTPEQQQIRNDFQGRFTLTLNYACVHYYIDGYIDRLRSALIPHLNSHGFPDQAQTEIQLKLVLIETHSP